MAGGSSSVGLDAKCALVVEMTNTPDASGTYPVDYVLSAPPAPRAGSPVQWDSFIQRICTIYSVRY
jgi:hypothetical protein